MHYEREIREFQPACEQEQRDREQIFQFLELFPASVLTGRNMPAHLTASSMILNERRDKVLMVYHNLYDSWSWTGGHADGEQELLLTALREAREETGIRQVSVLREGLYALDVLPVWGHRKKGAYVAAHMHLNLAYLLTAREEQPLRAKEDENSKVAWLPIEQLEQYVTEPNMVPIYRKMLREFGNC